MPRDPSNSPGSRALRLAGYVKLPGWWVTQEQLELIEYMAKQNLAEINRIKEKAYGYRTEIHHSRHDGGSEG
jgi:hypothetical protein